MSAMFGDVTSADRSARSKKEQRTTDRQPVRTLCDAIQFAIYIDDRAAIDALMGELALATADRMRSS
jgi:hypothetical protein